MDMDETVLPGQEGEVPEPEAEAVVVQEIPSSPKTQLTMALEPSNELAVEEEEGNVELDMSLNPFDGSMGDVGVVDVDVGLDMSALEPPDDGGFVGSLDDILGGPLMTQMDEAFDGVET
jgi:hypothetical protein